MRAQDVPSKHGWLWVKQGFDLFRKAPRVWLLMSTLWLILFFATLLLIWPIGAAIVLTLYPTFVALWVGACQQIDGLKKLEFSPAFAALAPNLGKLFVLGGLIVFVQTILTILASKLVTLDPALIALTAKYPNVTKEELEGVLPNLLTLMLVQVLVTTPIFLATWFAPPLITFRGMSVWHSIRWSVYACVANVGAMTVYGIVSSLCILAIVFLPGLLTIFAIIAITPIFFATIYTAYKDIFVE